MAKTGHISTVDGDTAAPSYGAIVGEKNYAGESKVQYADCEDVEKDEDDSCDDTGTDKELEGAHGTW